MKKKTLLSSILVIALCLTLIVGSTFALFTSEDSVNIVVDAGHVEIAASLTEPILYSVQPDANGAEFDENGKPYTYYEQSGSFANGGTATLNQTTGEIELENITPGDKIVFNLNGTNNSDVKVQYRYKLECVKGHDLMKGFVVTVNGTKYASMAAYTSAWEPLAKGENIMVDTVDGGVEFALELPVSAGNEFQDLSATIKLSVEAIQDNADISDTDEIAVQYITSVANEVELAAKLASDDYLHIFIDEDLDQEVVVDFDMTDKTIDANGNNVVISFGDKTTPVTLENVVIKNINDTPDETPAVTVTPNVSGDITITDSVLYNGAKTPYGAIACANCGITLDVTVDNCKLISGVGAVDADGNPVYGEKYGLYLTNANNVTVRNTSFEGFGSWAIIVNGQTQGNIVVSDCTFTNCAGILKTSIKGVDSSWQHGSLNGNLTFANNTMVNCTMKDGTYMQVKNLYGTLTFSNNTHNGVVVTPEDMKGIVLTNP